MNNSAGSRKFVIATHGALARGVQSALDMITGPSDNIFLIQAYLDGNKSIAAELQKITEDLAPDDELIFFSDLLGGSVNNQLLPFALRNNMHIVSGFNLPLVIEIILSDPRVPAQETIRNAILRAREQMVYVNELVAGLQKDNEHD